MSLNDDWDSITSIQSLKDAYYCARANFFRESFIDEVQIRLFDSNLGNRLLGLQTRLRQRQPDVAHLNDSIAFYFPKNATDSRIRASLRLEAEILSVAIIRYLNKNGYSSGPSSYAYRVNQQEEKTEFLYESWYFAHRKFLENAREAASSHQVGRVIRTDIEAFYNNIVQSRLIELVDEDQLLDNRIYWVLDTLLNRELEAHNEGYGLVQGSIGSGFFANIYLSSVDQLFERGNKWGVEFFRYVDDMILVIPNADHEEEVVQALHTQISELGLRVNLEKTESLSIQEFLSQTELDEEVENLNEQYSSLLNMLWRMTPEYREMFRAGINDDEAWWQNIRLFQQYLDSVGVVESETMLSRRIVKFLETDSLDLLDLPSFGVSVAEWGQAFTQRNRDWIESLRTIRNRLAVMFATSWSALNFAEQPVKSQVRPLLRRLRFALNKLVVLNEFSALEDLDELLRDKPWYVREPIHLLENLARQGYINMVQSLLTHYQAMDMSNLSRQYMCAIIIRALRYAKRDLADHYFEQITRIATNTDSRQSYSLAEQVMASETWLYRLLSYDDNPPNLFQNAVIEDIDIKENQFYDRRIETIDHALREDPSKQNNRLRGTLILVRGIYELNKQLSFQTNDSLLIDAMAMKGNVFTLVPEPKELRLEYYSREQEPDEPMDRLLSL